MKKGLIAFILMVLIVIVIGMQLPTRLKFWQNQVNSQNIGDDVHVTTKELPTLIKDYLLNNPEIIIEAVHNLKIKSEQESAKSAQNFIDKNFDELKKGKPRKGSGNIEIIEFFDYRCGYCKKSDSALSKILEENKNVQIIFVNTPMLGDKSLLAAKASVAIWDISPENFAMFHKDLMDASGIDLRLIEDLALKYNISKTKLLEHMNSKQVEEKLHNNMLAASSLRLQGIPAFILGKDLIPGNISYEDWKQRIDKVSR